ncbi:MAG: outer membrane protein assembly factor BamE [Rhodocyclaceae bacterium]|nr:outer membrane protein assembly factor BamE [Rhodocyclaceae bacterium]
MRSKSAFLCAAMLTLFVAGCGVTDKLRPYRIDVRQGNYVTQEMVSQLKKGMSRDQVRYALGTPVLNDVFHADRWDYVYRFTAGHEEAEQRVLTVYFDNDQLVRVDGDVTAASADAAPAAEPQRKVQEIDLGAPPAGDEKS